jgi:hypothetical protein
MDAEGRAISIWLRDEGLTQRLIARHYAPGEGWGEPRVMDLSGELLHYTSRAFGARIALSSVSGEAMLVWHQFDRSLGHDVLWSRRYLPALGWGPIMRVGDGLPQAHGSLGQASVAINPQGQAVAVWLQQQSPNSLTRNVWASRNLNGQWENARSLEFSPSLVAQPEVAIAPSGQAIAAWQQGEQPLSMQPISHVWVNHLEADGQWSGAHRVDLADGNSASEPRLAMAPDGAAVLLWRATVNAGADIGDLRASHYRPGTGWGPAIDLNAARTFLGGAQMAMDAAGNAMAIWHEFDPVMGLFDVWSRWFDASQPRWAPAERLDSEVVGDAAMPQIAMDPVSGRALAVWDQSDGILGLPGVRFSVATSLWLPGSGWGRPERIHTNPLGEMLFSSRVALSPNGTAVAVWTQGDLPVPSTPPKPDLPWASVFR